jgi:hypothetical protein
MLILDTTTKTLKINLIGAVISANPEFTVGYIDNSAAGLVEAAGDGVTNGTTDVTMVSAPASGTRRIVKYITVYNKDTAAITFNLKYDANGIQRQVAKVTLQPDETWYKG